MKDDYPTNSHYLIHRFPFKTLGECTVLYWLLEDESKASTREAQSRRQQARARVTVFRQITVT